MLKRIPFAVFTFFLTVAHKCVVLLLFEGQEIKQAELNLSDAKKPSSIMVYIYILNKFLASDNKHR